MLQVNKQLKYSNFNVLKQSQLKYLQYEILRKHVKIKPEVEENIRSFSKLNDKFFTFLKTLMDRRGLKTRLNAAL